MKSICWMLIVGAGCACPWRGQAEAWPASASQSNAVVIDSEVINRLLDEARTNNPGLLAVDSRARAATANVAAVRLWEDPMFTIGETIFSPQGFAAAVQGDVTYGISEQLPLWGKPALNRRAAAAAAATRHGELDLRFQQLRRDLARGLITAALAEQVAAIGEQDLGWIETTAKAVESKYRAGQTDAADSLQLQNEAAVRADQLRTDRLEVAQDGVALDRLVNRPLNSGWPPLQLPPVAPPVPFSAKLLALVLTNEPQLKVMEQAIEQARAAVAVARRSRLPDISVGVQGSQYSGDGGFRSGTFSLSLPLPWGNAAKYRSDYERERDNEKAAEHERDDQALLTREEVRQLTVDLDAARRQALLYHDEISPRALQALTDKTASWEAGKATLREVLDLRREALDAELMAVRATAEQYQTLAELLLWTGGDDFASLAPLANEPALTQPLDDLGN